MKFVKLKLDLTDVQIRYVKMKLDLVDVQIGVKVKLSLCSAMKAYWGSGSIAPRIRLPRH
jgi:hypothetical protein